MKKPLFLMLFVLALSTVAKAQYVGEDNFDRLQVSFSTPQLVIDAVTLGDGKYQRLSLDGFVEGGEVGSPALPVSYSLITIPFCSGMEVRVQNAVYDTLRLGNQIAPMPLQPSRSKSDRSEPVVHLDKDVYATDAFVSLPLASVEAIGVGRDRNLAHLIFAPVSVNPVTGDVIVCRKADVTVSYINADVQATVEHFRRYYTPAFSAGQSINQLFNSKDITSTLPIRMVIVAKGSFRCKRLDNFVNWKRTQGLMVDLVYYDEQGLNGNTAIANYLKSLYTNATAAAPAPTYLLLIGDHEQLPAFDSKISGGGWYGPSNDHITDLYYVTWTSGDKIPDCYQGRFSATDTTQLGNITLKTMQYERYIFENENYLSRAALIAGVDNTSYVNTSDNGYTYADPNMDYAARFYVNADNGFTTVTYYKNNTSFAPDGVTVTGSSRPTSTANALKQLYNGGVGWINYTAHGDWNEWSCPAFTVSDVSNMNNSGMPAFMIGNCCLSNKFEKSVCLGESLIRRGGRQGAIGYIGGTNSTYWSEDFYWSVGYRSSISNTMNTNYNGNKLGIYDRLFHTHDEAFTDRAVTAGSIVFQGNMSVQGTSSSLKEYYWEIYELMGDPSLMPWLGTAEALPITFDATSLPIHVHTVPHAYVTVVDASTYEIYAATFTDANGDGTLNVDPGVNLNTTFFSAIAQGYRPYTTTGTLVDIDELDYSDEPIHLYPNPATNMCTVKREDMKSVQLIDSRGSIVGEYTPSDSTCTIDLQGVPRGVYFVRVQTSDTVGTSTLVVR